MPVCAPVKHTEVIRERSSSFVLSASKERGHSYSGDLEKQMKLALDQVREGGAAPMREFLKNL